MVPFRDLLVPITASETIRPYRWEFLVVGDEFVLLCCTLHSICVLLSTARANNGYGFSGLPFHHSFAGPNSTIAK